ncbi:hypothetical protein B0A48_12598 [Cryoendolithus antarcticus]|uniref:Uncharacterized protein n=1 Tax=Cryoendolithus antarcticus TaxID=1507870 RepID=A0A1V8SRP8_9PEZI|nr:hypothetical protein B0A48_12598 [Cryoendolithus antarcticus]
MPHPETAILAEIANETVQRIFNFTQMFFFALSYMSSWEAIATNVGLAFYNGGPRALVWGCFIVFPGVLCQVASFAELSSIQPIAGAQYHWTWHLAPARYRRSITWFQGWITWFSWISLLAGVVNIAANVTTTIITANHPDYVVKSWHTILVMWAYLLVLGLMNMYAFWIIPYVEVFAGIIHIGLWISMASVLLALAPRHTAEFVFLQKANLSGWENDFVSFNLGIVLITWGFVGFDASAHISEETRRANSTIPKTMFWGIVANMLLAFGMILIFMTCLGDVDALLAAGYPLIAICLNATNSVAGASALVGGNLMTVITATIGRLTFSQVFPNYLPIDANYMNYALPINALIWIIALVTWFAWARNHWPGLNIELIDKIVADGD